MRSVAHVLAVTVLAVAISLTSACASKQSVSRGKVDELMKAIDAYNKNIRWKRPDLAAPLVAPDVANDYRDWSEAYADDVDIQDWRIRKYTLDSPVTATVEIERTQYEVRKLVQKKERVDQIWIYIDGVGWRLSDGF